MGNSDLCMICRALAINYKQFSSGAPDLLLIRLKRRRKRREDAGNIGVHDSDCSDSGGDCQDDDSHNACHYAGNDDGIDSDGYNVVDLSQWIDSQHHLHPSPVSHDRSAVVDDTDQDKDCSSVSMLLNDEDYHYLFESMYIEVKGPSDHLSFRQRVWLHLLNSGGDDNDGDYERSLSTSIPKAFVCQIEE